MRQFALVMVGVSAATLILLLGSQRSAGTEVGAVQDVSLTVYNQNLALVRELRPFRFAEGLNSLTLSGVAAKIDATSVHFKTLSGPIVSLLEQNYDYDLVSRNKLLQKYIGKRITLVDPENASKKEVTLLSVADGIVVESEGRILLSPPGNIELPQLTEGLLLKPTLEWLVDSPKIFSADGEVSYMTGGLSWNADYVALLANDEETAELEGWVSLNNSSGATYKDAKLKLIAGDIHRAPPPRPQMEMVGKAMRAADAGGFEEEAFFEYHLYTLGRRTTIKDNQTKQVSLLTASGIPMTKVYTFDPSWRSDKIEVRVEFKNSEENHVGMPLPAGRVRVFKRDSEQVPQLVGEDRIDHTPKDEMVRLLLGYAFDIKGEKRQTSYTDRHRGYQASYEVSLRNHKEETVTIVVPEHFPYANWKVLSASHEWNKADARTIEFQVEVPPDGEAKLTYSVDVWWE